jgi:hypothetical protein
VNNIVGPDRRAIKRRIIARQGSRSLEGAQRALQRDGVMPMIRNGLVKWLLKGDVIGRFCSSTRPSGGNSLTSLTPQAHHPYHDASSLVLQRFHQ